MSTVTLALDTWWSNRRDAPASLGLENDVSEAARRPELAHHSYCVCVHLGTDRQPTNAIVHRLDSTRLLTCHLSHFLYVMSPARFGGIYHDLSAVRRSTDVDSS